jgi:hypothetical protein
MVFLKNPSGLFLEKNRIGAGRDAHARSIRGLSDRGSGCERPVSEPAHSEVLPPPSGRRCDTAVDRHRYHAGWFSIACRVFRALTPRTGDVLPWSMVGWWMHAERGAAWCCGHLRGRTTSAVHSWARANADKRCRLAGYVLARAQSARRGLLLGV